MREADGACLDPRVRTPLDLNPPDSQDAQASTWNAKPAKKASSKPKMRASRHLALFSMYVVLVTLSQLVTVTNATAVRILQALMSMQGDRLVGDVHPVRLTLYRDQTTDPEIKWQEDQCFKLSFDTPYAKSDFWRPFSDVDGERPTCTLISQRVNTIDCRIGETESDLLFNFKDIESPDLTQIIFEFTNFHNPWSSVTVQSIRINSYASTDCSGASPSMQTVGPQVYYPKTTPASNVKISSNKSQLGDSSADNKVTFAWTPIYTTSKDGQGSIVIDFPNWYNVLGRLNMMFDESVQNSCTSPDMDILESRPDIVSQTVSISYRNMLPEKISGEEISITCQGFKNPIYQGQWSGFSISVFDSEDIRRRIEVTEQFAFDATTLTPSIIPRGYVTIQPTIFKIGEFSIWVLSVTLLPLPLESEVFVEILIPNDLRFQNVEFTGQGFMAPNQGDIVNQVGQEKNANGDTIVRFQAGFQQSTLGPSPQARLEINQISTPLAIKDTGLFYFSLYKDQTFNNKIAELAQGIYIEAGDLQTGTIIVNYITPEDPGVQLVTTYTIEFVTEHTLYADEMGGSSVQIQLPNSIILPDTNTILNVTPIQNTGDFFVATTGTVQTGNIIYIFDVFGTTDPAEGPLTFTLKIEGIKNPYSSSPAGNVIITTKLGIYDVDQGESNGSFTPQAGIIQGRPIVIINPVTSGTDSRYTLIFIPASTVPEGGYINIYVPQRLVLRPSEVRSDGVCTDPNFVCEEDIVNNIIVIKSTQEIQGGSTITFILTGITNPRNVEPTGPFKIVTFDTDGKSAIDDGFDIDTEMTELAQVDNFSVKPASDVNGAINTYTFTVTTKITIVQGDVIRFTFPDEIILPNTVGDLNITPVPRTVDDQDVTDDIKVERSGQTIFVTFITVAPTTENYSWTLDKIKNPASTQPTGPFVGISSVDVNGWGIQELKVLIVPAPVIINIKPATINVYELIQKNNEPATATTYELRFIPVNPIPQDGSIQVTWPTQVIIKKDDVQCTVITNRAWDQACSIDEVNRTINIVQVFSEQPAFISEVTIILVGVINPQNNKEKGKGFKITTYADSLQIYWIDLLPDDRLYPSLDCDYPCRTCLVSNRGYCQSCWLQDFSERKYFWSDNNGGYCLEQCPKGWTRDNEDTYVCIPCDVSCAACKDEDKSSCTECAELFPYTLTGTSYCLESCSRGYYETLQAQTCARCEFPCGDCEGSAKFCTWCDPESEFPYLFNNQCIRACAEGYTPVNGVCKRCESPCQNCVDTVSNCITCDGSLDRRYLYSGFCYAECPPNSTPSAVDDQELLTCISCADAACELCDADDTSICKRCSPGLYVHDGKCQSACPGGWKENKDSTACQLFTINDLGIIPFPFLMAAFIGCLIACFGKCKKKKLRASYISTQNTITCIIVIVAFIQFLAIIALIIWAALFSMMFLFYAAIVLLAILIILNIAFQIFYTCIFNRKITPKEKYRKYKEGKITKTELNKFIVPSDELFHRYVVNHRCVSCTIAIFTFMCTFKCNKAYYSHFYSFGMFKARWTQGKYYRKSMTIFCIVSMVIDALIICLCIASLLPLAVYSNMLWVTAVEVAVLSLLLIILGCVELYMMKEYLKYNERKTSVNLRQKFDVSSANDFLDKDSRQIMMKNLLMNVKTNQDMFLNNKLDDLLQMFGDRKCKSMIELGTGWDKELDPRQVITWPLSPNRKAEYDGEYHFTKDDMIGGYEDNVYADCKVPDPVYEVAVQGDQPQQDFMRQLHRKQGDLLASAIEEEDELAARRAGNKGKRRGRKNKYHAAIDAEDDEEADGQLSADENSNRTLDQSNLAIIREQEEEEEQLRLKVEEERIKQEKAAIERRQRLAEAERLRLEAEAAEEEQRRLEADEEERLRLLQEQDELEKMRLHEAQRKKMLQEEADAKRKAEEDEEERRKQLAALNETNRAKYEAEEAARKKSAQEEQERIRLEKEAHELKVQAELAELNKRKLEESQRLQAQRDEEELRLRKQMLEQEELERQQIKEAERIKIEQETTERLLMASKTADEKRANKLEEERLKREADEVERQRRIQIEDEERHRLVIIEEEKRVKRIQEEDTHRLRIEEEQRLHKERLLSEETERKQRLDQEEIERLERLRREEDRSKARMEQEEAERRASLAQQEKERLEQLQQEETLRLERLRVEEEQRLEALRIEEETRRHSLQKEEEARMKRIEEEEEARKRKEEEERQLKKLEDEKRAREEEDRILKEKQLIEEEKARLAELKAQQEAELAALAKREEERKLAEARETEERLERERLEREQLEKEKAELARRKKDAEDRLNQEMDEAERARLLKEAEDLERQTRLAKEREDFEQEKRRRSIEDAALAAQREAEKEAARKAAEESKKELGTQMSQDILQKVEDVISEKKLEEEDEALEAVVQVNNDAIKNFNKPDHPVEMPPNAENRTFNVNDILGELDRDNRGNIIVLEDNQGNHIDKTGQLTNIRGYLTNPLTGDILENHTNQKLFDAAEIDEKGEVPAPFSLEKFNFNPHDLMGDVDFQYDQRSGRAIPQLLQTKQGFYVDKKGRRVNRFGWLVQGGNGHIVDRQGRKKFDRKQLDDGDIQKLLNYSGKRYDVKDIIGVFEKDQSGQILIQKGPNGEMTDNVGRKVNEKGYLIDQDGNIIDREGRKVWHGDHLKNGEPPKIFLFTKFDIDKITGDFELSPLSEPILDEDANGNLVDRLGRLVNPRGYLVDKDGNIIDKRGKRMFDKNVLSPDGEIPKIFRMQILKTDSGSSLSRLMDEIEQNQPSEIGDDNGQGNQRVGDPRQMMPEQDDKDGDTSMDSAMEDTPANYNIANQRFDEYEDYEAIPEESDRKYSKRNLRRRQQDETQDATISADMPRRKTKKKGKKKKKGGGYMEYLMPTNREVNMADAYGGMAKGQFRRPGVKYDKERLMNRIKTPADIPGGKAQLEALAATVAGFHKPNQSRIDLDTISGHGDIAQKSQASRVPRVKRNHFIGDSQDAGSQMSNPNRRYPTSKGGRDGNNSALMEARNRKAKTQMKREQTEGDFEKMFGKDIDQYLEGSDFDLDEFDQMSHMSRGSGRGSHANIKLKNMEQMYLRRVESSNANNKTVQSRSKTDATSNQHLKHKSQKKPPAFREFQDRFVDQPEFVHRGEILEFETMKQAQSNTRKQKIQRDVVQRGSAGFATATNFEKQSKKRQ